MWRERLGRVLVGPDEEVVKTAPVFERGLLDRDARPPAADEVDEPVNPAVALDNSACPLPCGLDVEEVDRGRIRSVAQLCGERVERGLVATRQRQPCALLREQLNNIRAEKSACAGNCDHPVVERRRHPPHASNARLF